MAVSTSGAPRGTPTWSGEPERLRRIAERAIECALAAGAEVAEVLLRAGPVLRVTVRGGVTTRAAGTQDELALRVWRDERCALAWTGDPSPELLPPLAQRAVEEARSRGLAVEAPQEAPGSGAAGPSAVLDGGAVVPMDPDALASLVEAARAAAPGASCDVVWSGSSPWKVLVSSGGFAGAYRFPASRLWCWVQGPGRHVALASFGRRLDRGGLDALAERLRDRLGTFSDHAEPVAPGLVPAVLSPAVTADLARAVGQLLAAENVLRDLRPLLGRMGRPIASEALTLVDDPTLEHGPKSRPFDDEGTPARRTALVESGRLVGLLHTRETAGRLGVPPGGNAVREPLWQQPSAGPSNILLMPGDAPAGDLLRELDRGVEVTGTLRPGRLQAGTGKFTAVAHGWWIERGERVRPLRSFPISSPVFELLRAVRRCADDLELSPLADGGGGPSVLIDRLRVG